MNTTFETGITVAMLAFWALAVMATTEHNPPPMKPRVQQVAVVEMAASAPLPTR